MMFLQKNKNNLELKWFIFCFKNYNLDRLIQILQNKFGKENVYCPVYIGKKFNFKKNKFDKILKPFYPGYIFIKSNKDVICRIETNKQFLHTYFLKSHTGEYVSINEKEIDDIKKLEKEYKEGENDIGIKPGDKVVIIKGSFENLTGIVESVSVKKKFCTILINLLGRQVDLQIPLEKVRKL